MLGRVQVATDTVASKISILLKPHQEFILVSDFDQVSWFRNPGDTLSTISVEFKLTRVKELRTTDNQFLLLFPDGDHQQYALINNLLYPRNTSAKQGLVSNCIQNIGFIYSNQIKKNYSGLAMADYPTFIKERQKILQSDLAKIDSLVSSKNLDAERAQYWKALRQTTEISVIFQCLNFDWLSANRRDLFEKYCADLGTLSHIYGEDPSVALENLAWYFGRLYKNEGKSWPDFYIEHSKELGKGQVGKQFADYIANASATHRNTPEFRVNFEKISNYAKVNDAKLNEFIRWRTIARLPDMNKIYLFDQGNNRVTLKSIIDKSNRPYLLLDFWASWCIPCRQQIPYLNKLETAFSKKGIQVIGVSLDKKSTDWQTAISHQNREQRTHQFRINENNKNAHPLIRTFGLKTIPHYVLITGTGQIRIFKTEFVPSEKEFLSEVSNAVH